MRLRPWRKTKVLPSGIQVGCPANPALPRPPPPRPPALRVSSVIGCFWAKAEAARRRMLNFVMVEIVAIREGDVHRRDAETLRKRRVQCHGRARGGMGWETREECPQEWGHGSLKAAPRLGFRRERQEQDAQGCRGKVESSAFRIVTDLVILFIFSAIPSMNIVLHRGHP